MRMIDIMTDAVAHRAADQDIREEMVAPGETCNAYSAREPVRSKLNRSMIVVFVGNNGGQRPRFNTVT